jgi:hypothetical protein
VTSGASSYRSECLFFRLRANGMEIRAVDTIRDEERESEVDPNRWTRFVLA